MNPRVRVLALILLVGYQPVGGSQASVIGASQAYVAVSKLGQASLVLAPKILLDGLVLDNVTTATAEDCGKECEENAACSWFNWCPAAVRLPAGPPGRETTPPPIPYTPLLVRWMQEGCPTPAGRLNNLGCMLLAPAGGNATGGSPELAEPQGNVVQVTSGFPVRLPLMITYPTFTTLAAMGVAGADVQCSQSLVAGRCAFSSPLYAASFCSFMSACRTVNVFTTGGGGE